VNDASYDVLDLEALAYAQTAADIGIPLDGSAAFSIDAWVRLDGLCSSASIFSKDGVFDFGVAGDTLVLQIAGYPPVQSNPSQHPLVHTEWHYLTATYANGQVRLFVDGAFDTLQGISGTGTSNGNPFVVGYDLQAHVWSVRVYNTALTPDAVLANMFEAPAPGTIVADFDFSQTPPIDNGPRHLPIALQQRARMTRTTPALALSATAFAEPLSDQHVDPGGDQVDPYTVQAWVYVRDASSPQQAIFVNSELESDTGMALYLDYDVTASGFRVVSQRGSSLDTDSLTSTATIATGAWHNVATTFDGTTLTVYVDGKAAGSGPFGPIPLVSDAGRLLIGAALSAGQPFGAMTLQGFVSRLEVWERALSATEIATYMGQMPAMGASGLAACYDFTSERALNMVDGHPVGLADGAALADQLEPATPGGRSPTTAAPPERPRDLDDDTLRSLCESIDLGGLLDDLDGDFAAAAEHDAAAFADRDDQQVVREAWADAIARLRDDPVSARFLVTSHVVAGEHVVLCHRRGRTHVVLRVGVGDVDECTLWKIKLVFIVVAGAIDAFFGLSARLSDRAIQYIGDVLRQPRVAVLLGAGNKMSARGVFGLAVALFSFGYFKQILLLVVELGLWALIRVLAKLALKLAGIGAVDVIASLVATAATFVLEYARKPASCSPMPTVELAGIKFDYDPTATAVDALSIRRSYTTEVPAVQWTKALTKPEESPAAYAIARVTGKTVTMQASFLVTGGATSAKVKADGGGVLGAIDPFTVSFKGGASDPVYVTIPLTHQTLASGGVQRQDVEWTWSYQIADGAWMPLATTKHRIYVLLDTPRTPWQQPPVVGGAERQLPWTDVLDFACAWAAGATSAGAASAAVTQKVNGALGLSYDTSAGASKYTQGLGADEVFLCTSFVARLRGGAGQGSKVNCTDCASIVTAFANSLGCNVFASTMQPSGGGGFACNMIQAIGYSTWAFPFGTTSGGFSYHEVAWTGAGSFTDVLYDACLKLDTGTNPWNWSTPTDPSHVATLPLAMPFTTLEISPVLPLAVPFSAVSYRERLATNAAAGIPACRPQGAWPGTQGGRRKVI
jgi:hypothetical protein